MAQIIESVHPLLGLRKRPATHSFLPLSVHGYDEREYFVSGTVAADKAYKTRILVRAPAVAGKFNGVVVVEWLNVTAGFELEVVSANIRDLMLDEGYAWVGVTVQPLGVSWLQNWDAQRYGSLSHPDSFSHPEIPATTNNSETPEVADPYALMRDAYSNMIYGQVGAAIRDKGEMLFGEKAKHLIAVGASQSSLRLNWFVNSEACSNDAYEGALLWYSPGPEAITNDTIKVIALGSEMEVGWALSAFNGEPTMIGVVVPRTESPHPIEDTANFRLYQLAGAGHAPYPSLAEMQARTQFNTLGTQNPMSQEQPVSDFGYPVQPDHMLGEAALVALVDWVSKGVEPPHTDRISIIIGEDGKAAIGRDEYGNTKGGARLPGLDVPLGRHVGVNGPHPFLNGTRGGFVPFDRPTLKKLYPTKEAYVSAFTNAALAMVEKRLLRQSDADTLIAEAKCVSLP